LVEGLIFIVIKRYLTADRAVKFFSLKLFTNFFIQFFNNKNMKLINSPTPKFDIFE